MASLHNPAAAEELFQEFALRFLCGDFRHAHPQRGRFRDYVKASLAHLISNYYHQRERQPRSLNPIHPVPTEEPPASLEVDTLFLASWRDELLAQAWHGLAQAETARTHPFYTVLRFRTDYPKLSSQEMADQLGTSLGKALTASAVRQMLHRARERFADLLIEEVAETLGDPTDERLEEEFMDLGLYEYCRLALRRRRSDR
jgi:RNA polymerase sigma-70 factor (ECF subfamily)